MINWFKKKERPKITFWPKVSGLEEITPVKPHVKTIPNWYRRVPMWTYGDTHLNQTNDPKINKKLKEEFEDQSIPSWKKPSNLKAATVRKCPAIQDFWKTGYVIPMWTDVYLELAETKKGIQPDYKWETPSDEFIIEQHHNDQMLNHLTDNERENSGIKFIWKFVCPWFCKTPPGYSVLQLPMTYDLENQNEFRVLPGIIDTDIHHEINQQVCVYRYGKMTIKRGTSLCMYIPFKREEFDFECIAETPELKRSYRLDQLNIFTKFPGMDRVGAYQEKQKKCPHKEN